MEPLLLVAGNRHRNEMGRLTTGRRYFLGVLSLGFARGQAPPAPTPAAEKPAPEKKEAPPLCVDCHEDEGKSFRGNAHTRIPKTHSRTVTSERDGLLGNY